MFKRLRESVNPFFVFFSSLSIVLLYGALMVWTDCDYCEDLHAPPGIQLCDGTGSAECTIYYAVAGSACCSNKYSVDCDEVESLGNITYYWKFSTGTYCNGKWRCANRTSNPCQGDIVIPSSSDCSPVGSMIPNTGTWWDCP